MVVLYTGIPLNNHSFTLNLKTMYKIISVVSKNSLIETDYRKNIITKEIKKRESIIANENPYWVNVSLYMVVANLKSYPKRWYYVVDEEGRYHIAVADNVSKATPNIPSWVIDVWLKDNNVQFNVTFDELEQLNCELAKEDNVQLPNCLEEVVVTKEHFEVIQLTKSNNFILRHIKKGLIVILEKKHHKKFFEGLKFQVEKETWSRYGDVLVVRPFSVVIL
jgi:hypothetical protein